MGTYRNEWDCCGSVTETDAWEPDRCPFCTPQADAMRLSYLYGGEKTGSNALVEAEMRLFNGGKLTLEEARAAIDEAMRTPLESDAG